MPLAADEAQLLLTPNAQPVNLVEVAKAPGLGAQRHSALSKELRGKCGRRAAQVQKVLEERRRHLPLQTRRSRAVVRMLRQVLAGQAKLSSCAEFEAVGCKDTKPECK